MPSRPNPFPIRRWTRRSRSQACWQEQRKSGWLVILWVANAPRIPTAAQGIVVQVCRRPFVTTRDDVGIAAWAASARSARSTAIAISTSSSSASWAPFSRWSPSSCSALYSDSPPTRCCPGAGVGTLLPAVGTSCSVQTLRHQRTTSSAIPKTIRTMRRQAPATGHCRSRASSSAVIRLIPRPARRAGRNAANRFRVKGI
jgi:hypothetical protein